MCRIIIRGSYGLPDLSIAFRRTFPPPRAGFGRGRVSEVYYEFTDDEGIAILINAEAYIICEVTDIRKMDPIKDHVTSNGEAYIISSDVVEIVKNHPCAKALNRGVFALLECLTNYTRLDLVSKEQQDYFVGRFNENNRMIKRVSGQDTIRAMEILKNSMIEKGFDVE